MAVEEYNVDWEIIKESRQSMPPVTYDELEDLSDQLVKDLFENRLLHISDLSFHYEMSCFFWNAYNGRRFWNVTKHYLVAQEQSYLLFWSLAMFKWNKLKDGAPC